MHHAWRAWLQARDPLLSTEPLRNELVRATAGASNPHGRWSTLYDLSAWSFHLQLFGGTTLNSSLEVKPGRIIINYSYSLYVALCTWSGFTAAIPSAAQGPTHVRVQQLQTCWLHSFPHTHHGSSYLCTLHLAGCHTSLWRVNHLGLNTLKVLNHR